MSQNLLEHSPSYTNKSNIYDLFSQAEDAPGLILKELINLVGNQNLNLLDVGCGSGKYCSLLAPFTQSVVGIDQEPEQIERAKTKCQGLKVKLSLANATSLPFENASFDAVLSSWVLGTIDSMNRQTIALNEMKRVCKKEGKIILIENDTQSQFEDLRGRGFPDTRTQTYNDWLLGQGFKVHSKIYTYFEFDSAAHAQSIFSNIWGENLTYPVQCRRIEHKVLIFIFEN